MALPSEYEAYLKANLNWFERLGDVFSGLDERIDYTNALLTKLVELQGGIVPEVPTWATDLIDAVNSLNTIIAQLATALGVKPTLKNPEFIKAQQKVVLVAGTAVQMPFAIVPYDKEVVIKALSTNTGTIYIAPTKAGAEGHISAYPLTPSEAVGYKIANLNQLWIDSSKDNEGVVWTVEQEVV